MSEPGTFAANAPAPDDLTDCWRTNGVYGTRTCPQLTDYVHCRNCPIHARAGLEPLNRPVPAGYAEHWTDHFEKEAWSRRSRPSSAVPFRIAGEWLALPTKCFLEIAEWRPIHSIPHARQIVLGLANVRGELLICISLGHLLGLADVPPRNLLRAKHAPLLVLSWAGRRVGFPADEVQSPSRFSSEQVRPAPPALAKANPAFSESMLQWRQRTLILLDPDRLFLALNRNLT
ncbi:MAG TPA: chemotaxis protein CheW [Verrucomicrobiae bacterium]